MTVHDLNILVDLSLPTLKPPEFKLMACLLRISPADRRVIRSRDEIAAAARISTRKVAPLLKSLGEESFIEIESLERRNRGPHLPRARA